MSQKALYRFIWYQNVHKAIRIQEMYGLTGVWELLRELYSSKGS